MGGGHHRQRVVDDEDDDVAGRRWCSPTAASSTSMHRWRSTGRSSPRTARRACSSAPDVAHLRRVAAGRSRWCRTTSTTGTGRLDARRPGAVVGAGHGLRLPRDQPGPPRRRGHPADHRPVARDVLRRGDRRPARADFTSVCRRRRTTGCRTSSPRHRCRSTSRPSILDSPMLRRSPARRSTPTTPTPRRGGAPRSAPRTGTATPARCAASSRSWRTAAFDGVHAAVAADDRADLRGAGRRHRPRARRPPALRHRLRPAGARHAPLPARPTDLLLGRLGWLDGHHRRRPAHLLRLHDEPDGPGHHRRPDRRGS